MDLESTETTLLDSSLKSVVEYGPRPRQIYDLKVIIIGDYVQVYRFPNSKMKNIDGWEKEEKKPLKFIDDIDTDNLSKKSSNEPKSILLANAIRSKLNCQRIAKANINTWETFITLTFSDNVTDIKTANSYFRYWYMNIKKIKPNFKYIAVPEFQKRGAVHYHVLSNLGIHDPNVIVPQKVKTKKAIGLDTLYDIKYWSKGFARVDFIKGNVKKIVGYISKYMTEDIDNKLFGKHRYFNSQNLVNISTNYVNLDNEQDKLFYQNLLANKEIIYSNTYQDIYTKTDIDFIEYNVKDIN